MSRVGRSPIPIPQGVEVKVQNGVFTAKGPKGTVSEKLLSQVEVDMGEKEIQVHRKGESQTHRAMHGLMRSLLANAVVGVHKGFAKVLEVNGVGYKAEVKGKDLHLALGYSHPVIYPIPAGLEIEVDKNNTMTVRGANKQQVGQAAAEIRALRKPEPYKGKGIKYADETIRRKVGKAGAVGGPA